MLPAVRSFCFDHFTVEDQIDARIKCTAIWRQPISKESPLFEACVIRREGSSQSRAYIASVFQFCKAATRIDSIDSRWSLRHTSFVERNVVTSQIFRCGLNTFKTACRGLRCSDWFTPAVPNFYGQARIYH